jgi:hypothetical protein
MKKNSELFNELFASSANKKANYAALYKHFGVTSKDEKKAIRKRVQNASDSDEKLITILVQTKFLAENKNAEVVKANFPEAIKKLK